MKPFPVSSSILSATHLCYFLQEHYPINSNSDCSLIKAGINHTYLVTGNAEKYIFRVYSLNWRSEEEISEELRFINKLHENNIHVSYPIKNKSGAYIVELTAPEGKRFGVMFTYAVGEKFFNFSKEIHFTIGETMAGIHQNTITLVLARVTYNTDILLINSFEELKKYIPGETDEMSFMSSAQKFLLEEFEKADQDFIRKGIVHLDIWFDNLHINKNNQVIIFDFDFCGNGWVCLDIAYYLMQLYTIETDEQEYQAKAATFLAGYETIAGISLEEKRILPMLGLSLYFFYLGVQCQRFENYSNLFLNETYLKRYINLRVKKFADFHKLNIPTSSHQTRKGEPGLLPKPSSS